MPHTTRLPSPALPAAAATVVAGILSVAVHAQVGPTIGEIVHHWNFIEVHAGTNTPVAAPNGLLEPGEAMRMELTVSFTPVVGTPVNWSGSPPPGSGTIAGLHTIFFDLLSNGDTTGAWSHRTPPPGWIGSNGQPQPDGTLTNIQIGQIPILTTPIISSNPVERIWEGVWTPSSYEPRTIHWRRELPITSHPHFGTFFCQYGTDPTTGAALYATVYGHTPAYLLPITIIPAPGGALTIAIGGVVLARRRRCAISQPRISAD
jgi:hypothetical protein